MAIEGNNNTTSIFRSMRFYSTLVVIILIVCMGRDIGRPFCGLHSWDQAASAWRARNYLNYPLSYTKGLAVWSVGNPPTENPNRSLDHPQLGLFLPAIELMIFGQNETAARLGVIIRTILSLLIFIRILTALIDKKTAILAGLFFAVFPIIGYFGVRGWVIPVSLLATWYYLVTIGAANETREPKSRDKWILAVLLFLTLQISWEGFCYALAIGIHYLCKCLKNKKWPDKVILSILVIAPLSSLILNFVIMAGGHGWHWERIWSLYKWRSGKGELAELTWAMWFGRFWEHAKTNFGIPVLIISSVYLTAGQFILMFRNKAQTIKEKKQSKQRDLKSSRRFPQFWLFAMPGIFQLLIFRGALYPHQYWELPLVPVLAIAAAIGVMMLVDLFSNLNKYFAYASAGLLVGVCIYFCVLGLNHYFYIRWQPTEKIEMFKKLNSQIPPDKKLLSYEAFIVDQHEVKGPHYRPEVAWYLDRNIDIAANLNDVLEKTKTGQYPCYLVPQQPRPSSKMIQFMGALRSIRDPYQKNNIQKQLQKEQMQQMTNWRNFINQLASRYNYELINGSSGEVSENGEFLRAGMYGYAIIDLKNPRKRPTKVQN